MSEQNADYVERTCDQCAVSGRCILVDDCYICEDCIAFHERAVAAAAEQAWGSLPSTVQEYYGERRDRWVRLVAEVAKAYNEFTDEPAPIDGSGAPA